MKKRIMAIMMVVMLVTCYIPEFVKASETEFIITNDENGIPDEALYNKVLKVADSNGDDVLTKKEAEELEELFLAHLCLDSLDGIQYFKNLVYLSIRDYVDVDISPISELSNLKELYLQGLQLGNVEAVGKLVGLNTLYLHNCKITDITSLSKLKELEDLTLTTNAISDITPLKDMMKLQRLYLSNNEIEDITPLKDLVNLKYLDISYNNIRDIHSIEHLEIETLLSYGNPIVADMTDTIMQIENAQEGDTIEVELKGSFILPLEVIEVMKGKEITLNVLLENGIVWSINGDDITVEDCVDIDLSVEKIIDGNILEDEIMVLVGDRFTEQLVFAGEGTLSFPLQLTITSSVDMSKEKAVFIQNIEDTLQLEDSVFIANDTITFDLIEKADGVIVYGTNGDIDGDDKVTIKDTMQMLHHISNRSELNVVQKGFADVDMNDNVNLQDLMREMRYVSGRTDSLYEAE